MPPGPKQAEIDRAREHDPGSGFRFVAAERVSIQAPTTTRASVRQSNSSPGQELVAGFPAAPFLDEGRGDHPLLGEPVEEARCDEFAPVVERSTCGFRGARRAVPARTRVARPNRVVDATPEGDADVCGDDVQDASELPSRRAPEVWSEIPSRLHACGMVRVPKA